MKHGNKKYTCLAPLGFGTVSKSKKSSMSESDEYTKSITLCNQYNVQIVLKYIF